MVGFYNRQYSCLLASELLSEFLFILRRVKLTTPVFIKTGKQSSSEANPPKNALGRFNRMPPQIDFWGSEADERDLRRGLSINEHRQFFLGAKV
jgi:hypothetical protein